MPQNSSYQGGMFHKVVSSIADLVAEYVEVVFGVIKSVAAGLAGLVATAFTPASTTSAAAPRA